jgi:hypothetical protein
MADGQPDSIARHAVQVQTQQDVSGVAQIIGQPHYQHGNARIPRNWSRILNSQPVQLASNILNVGTKRIRPLAGEKFEVLRKDAHAGTRIVTKFYASVERERLGLQCDRF